MIKYILALFLFYFSSSSIFVSAQISESNQSSNSKTDSILKLENPRQFFLDSIKNSFRDHQYAAMLENKWLSDYNADDLFKEMISDIENMDSLSDVDINLPTETLKERLEILNAKSAFDIEYNQVLESVIKFYLHKRKTSMERFLGLSNYYFPIYEEILAKHNVPLEIKYLSIVESALNPKAVSRVGATGLWQFMYGTGKEYGLKIDTYVDERSDLLLSTNAACEYMKRSYKLFGDWDLVLASYNAGPGNVSKAIRRSGGKKNYWNIRPFLPKETQGYVPAFIATMYVMEFHKEHGLTPIKPKMALPMTDTVLVKNKLSFKQISDLLDISEEELSYWNPSYKRNIIPNIQGNNYYLRLPVELIGKFVSNEQKIYAFANFDFNLKEQPFQQGLGTKQTESFATTHTTIKYHKVRKGETLSGVAKKYGVSMTELKQLNGLRTNSLKYGQNLKIQKEVKAPIAKPEQVIAQTKKPKAEPKEILDSETVSKENKDDKEILKKEVAIDDKDRVEEVALHEIQYTIKKGDDLSSLSIRFNTPLKQIREWNKLYSYEIKPSDVITLFLDDATNTKYNNELLVEKNMPEKFMPMPKQGFSERYYTVRKGDTLYKISREIGVKVSDLKKWNQLDGDDIKVGTKLKIKA